MKTLNLCFIFLFGIISSKYEIPYDPAKEKIDSIKSFDIKPYLYNNSQVEAFKMNHSYDKIINISES